MFLMNFLYFWSIKMKYYINLTNGLEVLKDSNIKNNFSIIRIQSTACEQKRWNFILNQLSDDLLFNLAIGKLCIIYDYSVKKEIPRSIYQGIEWIKFVLYKYWLDIDYIPRVRNKNCYRYFSDCYKELDRNIIKKLKYFKKFIITNKIKLIGISTKTMHDNDYNYYKNIIENNII